MAEANTDRPPLVGEIEEIRRIVGDFESLVERFEERLAQTQAEFQALLGESDELVRQAKLRLTAIQEEVRRCGMEPAPEIALADERLRTVWLALYQFHGGATADEVADRLNRHRTTVSTYLNMLTAVGYAEKERRGHEIYYRALTRGEDE